ncbi:hypothetical protein CIW49_09035 [Mycolicibacterium sp. P1-18]|uniref:hypothetical protein n=1 Tax=Mycolicibacterium sp. P1-18 TaxID=2024615 RepID=UPI0011F33DCA|nr:hypothetical protein [Mycolicibacterium sp. P1-18]KAA0099716.1 hypothetical protein CIW49_09035 [Mycolicibacterium sp. P1-18]
MYSLHKLLWDIRRNAAVKDAYMADGGQVLDSYGVSGDLRSMMQRLDFKGLYEAGVNPYLLYFCAIQLEIDRAEYYARIRGEMS